jgi:hypothetical protein
MMERKRKGGKCSPRARRFFYISTDRTPITPKLQAII